MKRIIAILMACLFALSFTIAFAQGEKKLGIVCTTFPQYDWVRQILGDRVNDVGIGLYRSFREAFVARMETRIFNPDRQANAVYRKLCPLFEQAYESLGKVSDGLALFRESAE